MKTFKRLALQTEQTVDDPPYVEDCHYIVRFEFTGEVGTIVGVNGNYCGGGSFDFGRTLSSDPATPQVVNACVDLNSLTYTVGSVTPIFDDIGNPCI